MSPKTWEQFERIREDRKKLILEAALQEFAETGYHAASISKISKRAGVSKGLMYNYFESKEAVLRTLLLNVFESSLELMAFEPGLVVTDQHMIDHVNRSFDMVIKDPLHWKLYFTLVTQPIVLEMAMELIVPKAQPFIEQLTAYFASKGHEDPMTMMQFYSSSLKGAHMQTVLDPEHFPHEKIKALIIKQFILS